MIADRLIVEREALRRLSDAARLWWLQAVAWIGLAAIGLWVVLPAINVSTDQTLVRAAPLTFTGLAVALPARAGLVNIGGEGQFAIGTVTTMAVVIGVGDRLPAPVYLPLLVLAGAAGGLAWAGIAAILRVGAKLSEALSTLLLNFVAPLVLAYFVYGPWRDPTSFNLPLTRELPGSASLPTYGLTQLHLGIVLAVVAALVVWFVLGFTRWGFRTRVVGGNPEAARRSGLHVTRTMVVALAAGGALAGLGGMIELTGVEGVLRPGIGVGFGYIGFLASWMVGHRPLGVMGAALLLAAISVGGDSLQIDHGLPSTSVYILMALVVLIVLGARRRPAGIGR